jgi:alkanesulfonate monooxygenase
MSERNPWWLTPFQNYKTFCPYLVGSHHDVAREVGRFMAKGIDTFILDIPPSRDELEHIGAVFDLAAVGALT